MGWTIGLVLLGWLWAPLVAAASLEASLSELRHTFTLDGKPIPPKVFADFGDDDLADSSHSIWVTVDLLTAVGSNLYAEQITGKPGGWLSQKGSHEGGGPGDDIAYTYIGATRNGLMLVVAALRTTGTGVFHTLHVLDASSGRAFDEDGKSYDRLNLTVIRNIPLGDRWNGDVKISGDTVTVTTRPGEPNNGSMETKTTTFEARRP